MNRVIGGVVLVLALMTIACDGMIPKREVVKDYCDTEVAYTLWKQESGYWLNLHVGPATMTACSVNPNKTRLVNLSQKVSSPEEADKLVEKHRQSFAEKLAKARKE